MNRLASRKGQSTLENLIAMMIVGAACYALYNTMVNGDDSLLGKVWKTVSDNIGTIFEFAVAAFT